MADRTRKPFIAGNWKMNLCLKEADALALSISMKESQLGDVRLAVFPAFTVLAGVAGVLAGSRVELGGQDIFWEDSGAFTGEISGPMLKDAGCDLVLVGHSERRAIIGETDAMLNRKLKAARASGLEPVLCVGENLAQRESVATIETIKGQLSGGLDGIGPADMEKVTVAYEPVWAIGTGKTASPEQAQEAHAFIRGWLAEKYGKELAARVIILYGGSVKPDNAFSLYRERDVDGFLVGGASLKADGFIGIARESLRAVKEKK